MSPVTDLARRVRETEPDRATPNCWRRISPTTKSASSPSALDDYSTRLTELVQRDREFNADVSHELRTPLAVIASTTELLQVSPDLAGQAARTAQAHRARGAPIDRPDRRAAAAVAQRASGADRRRNHRCGQAWSSRSSTRSVRTSATSRSQVRIDVDEPLAVVAPSSVVSVALGNLIGNAFKYTPAGEVIVIVGHGRVTVEDTGPGIKPEDAEKLFERGVRGTDGRQGRRPRPRRSCAACASSTAGGSHSRRARRAARSRRWNSAAHRTPRSSRAS